MSFDFLSLLFPLSMAYERLESREREKVLRLNAMQSAKNADGKKKHDAIVANFYDRVAEKMEPIVRQQLQREGQAKRFF